MKLDYKKTIQVGLAFFIISLFWQAYDTVITQMLAYDFGLEASARGAIMGIDNLLALFMLPLFGALSDKTKSRLGRRTPYILFGTIAAAISFVGLTIVDNMQLNRVVGSGVAAQFDANIAAGMDKEAAAEVARQAAQALRIENPQTLIWFMVLLLITLVSMGVFRSPAVALMPDVTMKPLRSKGNAIINLTGAIGGAIFLVMNMLMAKAYSSYTPMIAVVSGIMIVALILFMIFVNEPQLVDKMVADSKKFGIEDNEDNSAGSGGALPKAKRLSFILILASIMLWFFGYNAATTHFAVVARETLGFSAGLLTLPLMVGTVSGILCCIPSGQVASRIGRRKTILIGITVLTLSFVAAYFVSPEIKWLFYPMFAIIGFGFAFINVNSLPMVVELSRGSDVGKFTGYYYVASTIAQTVTPTVSGFVMEGLGNKSLFLYAAFFVGCSFITMFFVKHGDSVLVLPKSKLELLEVDD